MVGHVPPVAGGYPSSKNHDFYPFLSFGPKMRFPSIKKPKPRIKAKVKVVNTIEAMAFTSMALVSMNIMALDHGMRSWKA